MWRVLVKGQELAAEVEGMETHSRVLNKRLTWSPLSLEKIM